MPTRPGTRQTADLCRGQGRLIAAGAIGKGAGGDPHCQGQGRPEIVAGASEEEAGNGWLATWPRPSPTLDRDRPRHGKGQGQPKIAGVPKDNDGDGPFSACRQGWRPIVASLALDCGRCDRGRFRWISAGPCASQDEAGNGLHPVRVRMRPAADILGASEHQASGGLFPAARERMAVRRRQCGQGCSCRDGAGGPRPARRRTRPIGNHPSGNPEDDKPYLICNESIGMIVDAEQPDGVATVHRQELV